MLLDPRQKGNWHKIGVDELMVEEGKSILKQLMLNFSSSKNMNEIQMPKECPEPRAKKRKLFERKDIGDLQSDCEEQHAVKQVTSGLTDFSVNKELEDYFTCSFKKTDDFNILQWWKMHSNDFPKLFNVVRSILCVPASSSASEYNFSDAGNVISEKRTLLKPKTVADILFLKSNYDLVE